VTSAQNPTSNTSACAVMSGRTIAITPAHRSFHFGLRTSPEPR
jgi:hypothetical protein